MNEDPGTITWSRTAERMSALTLVFSCLAMLVWVLSLIRVQTAGVMVTLHVLPAAAAAGAFYLLNSLLMERRSRLALLLVLDAVLAAGSALLFYGGLGFDPQMPAARIGFTALYVFCLAAALYVAWEPIRPQTVIGCFDWTAVLLILYLALQKTGLTQLPVQVPALCAGAMGLSFLTMIRMRLERTGASGASVGNEGAGRFIMAVLVMLIAGAAILIGAAAAGALHGISTMLWTAVVAVGTAVLWVIGRLYHLLELFALWLSQFFTPETYEEIEIETSAMETVSSAGDTAAAQVPAWFYVLAALLAAALILYFLFRIRHVRMEKAFAASSRGSEKNVRRHSRLKEAVLRLLGGAAQALHLRILYLKKRTAPAGRLFRCERQFRRTCPRRTGESGEAYLRRLAADPAGSDRESELRELADEVERAFYAEKK